MDYFTISGLIPCLETLLKDKDVQIAVGQLGRDRQSILQLL
jgi:hypothetical protein